jgi:hypothetical protein
MLLGHRARLRVARIRAMRENEIVESRRLRAEEMQRVKIEKFQFKAATACQRIIRGWIARRKYNKLKARKAEEKERFYSKIPIYYRIKDNYYQTINLLCRPYIIVIQCSYRCHAARMKVNKRRLYLAAIKVQVKWRNFIAIKRAKAAFEQKKKHHKVRLAAVIKLQRFAIKFKARLENSRHQSADIIKWFILELRTVSLIQKAVLNFR